MGAIPSGKGGERFPPTSNQPKGRISRELGGGAAGGDDLLLLLSGRSEGKKGRVGEKRLARAQDIGLVAPVHVARQRGPRHRRRGAALVQAASVATLSRHMHWRDQTGYALQIKTNTS